MPSPTQSDPAVDALPTVRPADLKDDGYPYGRSSVGKRALITLVRFLIIFCLGVSTTLAWQSYGDTVREIIASSYPQLSWLAPQAETAPLNASDVIGLASRAVSSPDQRQPNAMSLDLDAVRQDIDRIATSIASSQEQMTSSADRIATSQQQIAHSVERIATSQEQMMSSVEQMMRSVDQFTTDQKQMTHEITKLQEVEQSIRSKNSEPSPRPASASAPKPVSRPASASKPKPVSRASPEPTGP
jgi:peptidoglycan hydrolase CwlO-like protein